MKFVERCIDIGAPEYAVTGIASVERISPGMVRVSKYSQRPDGNIIVTHEVWDVTHWRAACEMIHRACEGILAEPAPGEADRPRLAH